MLAKQHSYLATHIEGRGKICPDRGKTINSRMKIHIFTQKFTRRRNFPPKNRYWQIETP